MKRTLYFFFATITATLLAGCEPAHPPKLADSSSYQQPDQEFQQYAGREQNLLSTTQQHIDNGNMAAASETLSQIKLHNLLPAQKVSKLLLEAQILLHNNKALKALPLLKKAEAANASLIPQEQLSLQKMLTEAYFATDDILSALSTSAIAASLIDDENEKIQFLTHVWQKLQPLNTPELEELYKHAENSTQRGWLALTLATDRSYDANNLINKLKQWETSYFNHPAQALIPNFSTQTLVLTKTPKRITLLLPLNGALAKQGRAIRNGFLAAFYQSKSQGFAPDVKVLDTSQENIGTLYQKAINTNSDLVVGPLSKNNIEQLVSSQVLSIPVIALNTIPANSEISNLYQFGLSPEDEAQQVAKKMKNDRHQRILVIAPDSAWGKRITTAFENTWRSLGGDVIDQFDYHSRKALAHQLRVFLNLDQSKKRELSLRWLLHKKLRYIPRRRQDFDAIFLVASSSMGRQILPLLRFYYANETPIYSTSEIYQAYNRQKQNRDLNGVIFDDMPWLFSNNSQLPTKISAIRANAESAWPGSFKHYARFYALGADAFNLIPNLNKLILLPNLGVSGATGTLYLQPNGQVYRQLVWAQIQNGKPSLLN